MAMPAWVSERGVASSVIIATVAIWGERIRAALFRADLRLGLAKDDGERATVVQTQALSGSTSETQILSARYYRLRVTNRARYPAAHEVEVLLTQLDKRGPDGRPQPEYKGALPLTWQHQSLYSKTRTIGRTTIADVDLLFVCPDFVRLTPMLDPLNFATTMRGEQHFWVTVVARGLDAESKPLRLKVDWDGNWALGDTEMLGHFKVSIVQGA